MAVVKVPWIGPLILQLMPIDSVWVYLPLKGTKRQQIGQMGQNI